MFPTSGAGRADGGGLLTAKTVATCHPCRMMRNMDTSTDTLERSDEADTDDLDHLSAASGGEKRFHAGGFKIADEDKGTVTALFAKLNVIDLDGDVTLPGFFGDQETSILRAHNTRELAVGKGQISEVETNDGTYARFDGQFNLRMPEGISAFESVKFQGDRQEWSYGWLFEEGGFTFGDHEGKRVRFLTPTGPAGEQPGSDVSEISPVVKGAGIGTRTLEIKSPTRRRFLDQIADTVETVRATATRAADVQTMRAEKGRNLGSDSVDALSELVTELKGLGSLLSDMLKTPEGQIDGQTDILSVVVEEATRKAATLQRMLAGV